MRQGITVEKKSMVGFSCSTPYHLLLSLHMAVHEFAEDDKVLILFDHLQNSSAVVPKLRRLGIFKSIVYIDDGCKWKRWMYYVSIPGRLRAILQAYEFKEFIFFHPDPKVNLQMIACLEKRNRGCMICLGEDGLGTYLRKDAFQLDPTVWKRKWALKLFGRDRFFKFYKRMYLVNPALLAYRTRLEIVKIHPLDLGNDALRRMLHAIWGEIPQQPYDIVFFQQPFREDKLFQLEEIQKQAIDILCAGSKGKKVSVKLHPRAAASRLLPADGKILPLPEIPFEITFSSSMNQKTMVTVFSSAVLTPFLLAGLTPNLVILSELIPQKDKNPKLDAFYHKFKAMYERKGGRMFFPKSFEEYRALLQSV